MCDTTTGDVNLDGSPNIGDVALLINFLKCDDELTDEQLIQSDVNGDCRVDLADVDYFVAYIFQEGPELVPCMCVEKEVSPCRCTPTGDVNLDGSVNVGDCYWLGQFLSCQTELEPQAITNSDMDANCLVDQADADYCIDYIFGGGPEPAPCVCHDTEITRCRCNLPGDVNLDGSVNVGDLYWLGQILSCQTDPEPQEITNSDVNADCQVNQVDADYLQAYIFGDGDPPAACVCSEPEITRGDVNLDGDFNIGDCYLLGQFLSCQIELTPLQITNSDMNADCLVDQADLDYCIDHIFGGGPAPAACVCSEPSFVPCE
ncbi:MAG: hypothetical protein GY856_51290 [bacterium]|nr:hypothetical protein [bacterium]